MKIIKIIFCLFLAFVLIAGTGLFIFFQIFETDQYIPQITKKITLITGRPVSMGQIGLGFSAKGISLDVGPIVIADDPSFTLQPFVKIDRVQVGLGLRSLILEHRIHIKYIIIEYPQVHFIRSEQGSFNIGSISHLRTSTDPQATSIKESNQGVLLNITPASEEKIKSNHIIAHMPIIIQDGVISFIDQTQVRPLDVWVRNINARVDDFSLSNHIQLSFNASPIIFKSTSPAGADNPVFNKLRGSIQLLGTHLQGADISITDGMIKNFNVADLILSHVMGSFGMMSGNIGDLIKGQLNSKFGANDTDIQEIQAKFSILDKTITIGNALVKTDIFELTAQGSVEQGLNMDLQTMLHLNKDVSAALVNQFDGLRFFCDDNKQIAIGASLKGAYPHLKYKPNKDFKKRSKKALNAMFRQLFGA